VHGVGAANEHEEMLVREIEAMRGEMGRVTAYLDWQYVTMSLDTTMQHLPK